MKTKTRKTPLMMTPVFDLTCCPSPFVPESELSHNVEAHHGLVPKPGHHEWKNPALLKNIFSQSKTGISGCAAGFLVFCSLCENRMHLGITQTSFGSALGFHCFSSDDVFSCAATSDGVRACAVACSQAQSHDSSTGLEELKHQQRGFQGFC
jgi:hypothetical protein